MTPVQKITLRLSEVRSRLNSISGIEGEEFTDEIKNEAAKLQSEFQDLEIRHRAAIVAETAETDRRSGEFDGGDSEDRERNKLLSEICIIDYLGPASSGSGIEGRARELNSALGAPLAGVGGGVAVPWAALEEHRAFTQTSANDGPESQRPILQRLFGAGVMDTLGVRMDSVPIGRSEWPLVTGGVAPAQAKEEAAAAAAVTATFAYATLKPKRLTGRFEYTHEAAASVPDLEGALRRDLADAVKSSMENQIINGAAPTTSDPQNVEGFITGLTAADDTTVADAARYGRLHSEAVDGIHSSNETEVTSVIGITTYVHSAGEYISGSGESGSELLNRRSGGCMASTYIPAVASKKQSAILHSSGPNGGAMRGDSVAAIWPTLEIIRDPYTQASQGVTLTWVSLWDAKVAFRAAAYKLIGIKLS